MEAIDNDRVRFDMVWTNAWGIATLDAAENLTPTGRDPRERPWFDADPTLGVDIADKVPGSAPVYDLLMIWDPERTWGDDGDDTLGTPDVVWTAGWTVEEVVEEVEARLPDCEGVVSE
jgi:hypothetical protein